MKPCFMLAAFMACVIAIPTSGNINDTPIVEVIKEAPAVDLINKTDPPESISNPSKPTIEILSTRAQGTIQVKLGALQHSLGILDGPVLYDTVYEALTKICHWEDGTCCPGSTLCQTSFVTPGVANNGRWGEVSIQITIVNSSWQRSMGIRRLMMCLAEYCTALCKTFTNSSATSRSGTIAGIFQEAAHINENCHVVTYEYSKICNIGDFVGVRVPGGADTQGKESSLELFIRSNGYDAGYFFCDNLRDRGNWVVDQLKDEYQRWLYKSLDRNVYCVY